MCPKELSPQEKLQMLQKKSAIGKQKSFANLAKSVANVGQLISPELEEVPATLELKRELWFVVKTCFNLHLLMTSGVSSVITVLVQRLDDDNEWKTFFSQSSSAAAFVGAFLSFALVFRTNICCKCGTMESNSYLS
mmetsp:Transcript_327/g.469  ORF Transcript_327/g.469 Transcript_327/m.469 type:complete len:136 (+) Transcript_327:339-746(+)